VKRHRIDDTKNGSQLALFTNTIPTRDYCEWAKSKALEKTMTLFFKTLSVSLLCSLTLAASVGFLSSCNPVENSALVSGSCIIGESSCYHYSGLANSQAESELCTGGRKVASCESKGCLGSCTASSAGGTVKGFFYTGDSRSIGITCTQGGGSFNTSCN